MADLGNSKVFGDLTVTGKIKADELKASTFKKVDGTEVAYASDLPTKLSQLTKDINFDEKYYTKSETNTKTEDTQKKINAAEKNAKTYADGLVQGFKNNIESVKYEGDKLFLKVNGKWIEHKSGNQNQVGNVFNFSAGAEDKQIVLTWQDPPNATIDDGLGRPMEIAKWKGTKILRKIGSYPANENDGVLVVDNGLRNQYRFTGFVDTGLINDRDYYYMAFPYTENDVYTVDKDNRVSATPSAAKIYGVVIDESNSNPETRITYTDGAVGFTPMSGNDGNFQWGSWEKVFNRLKIKPCVVRNPQKTVNYYLDPNDYTKKLEGGPADITSGDDGDVMVEFPKLYWKMWKVGTKQYVQFSEEMFDGAKCPAHTVGNTEKDKIYISVYMGNSISNKLRSLSGKTPVNNNHISTQRSRAQNNGSGYQQMGYYPLLMLQVLYIVFFKSGDAQKALGKGYVSTFNGSQVSTRNTGGANEKGMFYGDSTSNTQQIKFCGIEDFWGNLSYFIDGFYSDASRNMLISKQDVFNNNGSGYVNHGQGASADRSGYIDSIQGGTDTGFVLKTVSGSSTTHYVDYGILNKSRVPTFSYTNSGAFRLYVNRATNDYNHYYISARLCIL